MPKTTSNIPRIFCFGKELGVIVNKKFCAVNAFNKRRFKLIIIELIQTKKYGSAELLLKAALKKYLGYEEIAKIYQGQGITDSEFYMKWRDVIKKHKSFYENAAVVNEKTEEWRHNVENGRVEYLRQIEDKNIRYALWAKHQGRKLSQL